MSFDGFQRQVEDKLANPLENQSQLTESGQETADPELFRDSIESFLEKVETLGVDQSILNSTDIDELFLEELSDLNREQSEYEEAMTSIIDAALSDFIFLKVESFTTAYDNNTLLQIEALTTNPALAEYKDQLNEALAENLASFVLLELNRFKNQNSGNYKNSLNPFLTNQFSKFRTIATSANLNLDQTLNVTEINTFFEQLFVDLAAEFFEQNGNYEQLLADSPFKYMQNLADLNQYFASNMGTLEAYLPRPAVVSMIDSVMSLVQSTNLNTARLTEAQVTEAEQFYQNNVVQQASEILNMSIDFAAKTIEINSLISATEQELANFINRTPEGQASPAACLAYTRIIDELVINTVETSLNQLSEEHQNLIDGLLARSDLAQFYFSSIELGSAHPSAPRLFDFNREQGLVPTTEFLALPEDEQIETLNQLQRLRVLNGIEILSRNNSVSPTIQEYFRILQDSFSGNSNETNSNDQLQTIEALLENDELQSAIANLSESELVFIEQNMGQNLSNAVNNLKSIRKSIYLQNIQDISTIIAGSANLSSDSAIGVSTRVGAFANLPLTPTNARVENRLAGQARNITERMLPLMISEINNGKSWQEAYDSAIQTYFRTELSHTHSEYLSATTTNLWQLLNNLRNLPSLETTERRQQILNLAAGFSDSNLDGISYYGTSRELILNEFGQDLAQFRRNNPDANREIEDQVLTAVSSMEQTRPENLEQQLIQAVGIDRWNQIPQEERSALVMRQFNIITQTIADASINDATLSYISRENITSGVSPELLSAVAIISNIASNNYWQGVSETVITTVVSTVIATAATALTGGVAAGLIGAARMAQLGRVTVFAANATAEGLTFTMSQRAVDAALHNREMFAEGITWQELGLEVVGEAAAFGAFRLIRPLTAGASNAISSTLAGTSAGVTRRTIARGAAEIPALAGEFAVLSGVSMGSSFLMQEQVSFQDTIPQTVGLLIGLRSMRGVGHRLNQRGQQIGSDIRVSTGMTSGVGVLSPGSVLQTTLPDGTVQTLTGDGITQLSLEQSVLRQNQTLTLADGTVIQGDGVSVLTSDGQVYTPLNLRTVDYSPAIETISSAFNRTTAAGISALTTTFYAADAFAQTQGQYTDLSTTGMAILSTAAVASVGFLGYGINHRYGAAIRARFNSSVDTITRPNPLADLVEQNATNLNILLNGTDATVDVLHAGSQLRSNPDMRPILVTILQEIKASGETIQEYVSRLRATNQTMPQVQQRSTPETQDNYQTSNLEQLNLIEQNADLLDELTSITNSDQNAPNFKTEINRVLRQLRENGITIELARTIGMHMSGLGLNASSYVEVLRAATTPTINSRRLNLETFFVNTRNSSNTGVQINPDILQAYESILPEYMYQGIHTMNKYPFGPNIGWKFHLNVSLANVTAVSEYLKNAGFKHKYLSGGDYSDGKVFTVYVGDCNLAQTLANKISNEIGNLLDNPVTNNTQFAPKIPARFDGSGISELNQYGPDWSPSIPHFADSVTSQQVVNHRRGNNVLSEQEQHRITNEAYEFLANAYGEHFTGSDVSQSPNEARTPSIEIIMPSNLADLVEQNATNLNILLNGTDATVDVLHASMQLRSNPDMRPILVTILQEIKASGETIQEYVSRLRDVNLRQEQAEILDQLGLHDSANELRDPTRKFSAVDGLPLSTPEERLVYIEKLQNLSPIELLWYRTRPPITREFGEEMNAAYNALKNFTAQFISNNVLPELLSQNLSIDQIIIELHRWQTRGSSAQLDVLMSPAEGYDIAGKYRHNNVSIGSFYKCPSDIIVPRLMQDYSTFIENISNEIYSRRDSLSDSEFEIIVVQFAAEALQAFVDIHPMRDGNGRTSRMIYEYIIVKFLGPDHRFRTIPMSLRESGEETINFELTELLALTQRRDYISPTNQIPPNTREATHLIQKLQTRTLDNILNDPITVQFRRTLIGLIDNLPFNSNGELQAIIDEVDNSINIFNQNYNTTENISTEQLAKTAEFLSRINAEFNFEQNIVDYTELESFVAGFSQNEIVRYRDIVVPPALRQFMDYSKFSPGAHEHRFDSIFKVNGLENNPIEVGIQVSESEIKLVEINSQNDTFRILSIVPL